MEKTHSWCALQTLFGLLPVVPFRGGDSCGNLSKYVVSLTKHNAKIVNFIERGNIYHDKFAKNIFLSCVFVEYKAQTGLHLRIVCLLRTQIKSWTCVYMESKGKEGQKQANGSGSWQSKQEKSPESGDMQFFKKKAGWAVCFLFAIIAHSGKCRERAPETPNLTTQRGALTNTACCVGQHGTLCL